MKFYWTLFLISVVKATSLWKLEISRSHNIKHDFCNADEIMIGSQASLVVMEDKFIYKRHSPCILAELPDKGPVKLIMDGDPISLNTFFYLIVCRKSFQDIFPLFRSAFIVYKGGKSTSDLESDSTSWAVFQIVKDVPGKDAKLRSIFETNNILAAEFEDPLDSPMPSPTNLPSPIASPSYAKSPHTPNINLSSESNPPYISSVVTLIESAFPNEGKDSILGSLVYYLFAKSENSLFAREAYVIDLTEDRIVTLLNGKNELIELNLENIIKKEEGNNNNNEKFHRIKFNEEFVEDELFMVFTNDDRPPLSSLNSQSNYIKNQDYINDSDLVDEDLFDIPGEDLLTKSGNLMAEFQNFRNPELFCYNSADLLKVIQKLKALIKTLDNRYNVFKDRTCLKVLEYLRDSVPRISEILEVADWISKDQFEVIFDNLTDLNRFALQNPHKRRFDSEDFDNEWNVDKRLKRSDDEEEYEEEVINRAGEVNREVERVAEVEVEGDEWVNGEFTEMGYFEISSPNNENQIDAEYRESLESYSDDGAEYRITVRLLDWNILPGRQVLPLKRKPFLKFFINQFKEKISETESRLTSANDPFKVFDFETTPLKNDLILYKEKLDLSIDNLLQKARIVEQEFSLHSRDDSPDDLDLSVRRTLAQYYNNYLKALHDYEIASDLFDDQIVLLEASIDPNSSNNNIYRRVRSLERLSETARDLHFHSEKLADEINVAADVSDDAVDQLDKCNLEIENLDGSIELFHSFTHVDTKFYSEIQNDIVEMRGKARDIFISLAQIYDSIHNKDL